MKKEFLIIILSFSLLLSISTPSEAQEDTCSSSFHLLEADLLSRPQNRFLLATKFFPPRDANPVIIKVDYVYEDSKLNNTNVWFWSESEFYLIQPLEIFLYTSLFFANQPYRQSTITLELSADCLNAEDLHMKVLTQRLALYAQSATTSPTAGTKSISDGYIASAANWVEIQKDSLISDFTKVWLHLVLVLFPLLTWLMLYLCDPVNLLLGDKTWQKLADEHSHPVIAALIQVSALFTFFVFALDWVAFAKTVTGDFLAYDRNAAFYLSAATGLLIDFGAFGWVVYVLISICHFDLKHYWQYLKGQNPAKQECPEHIKKLMYTIMLAPILCLSNHLYYIILAFISDPFHAGFIMIGYVITFFLFYFVFRQFYGRVVLRSNRRQEAWEKEKIAINVATSQIDVRYQLARVAKEKGDEEAYQMFTDSGMEPKPLKVKPKRRILRVPFNTQVVVFGLILIGPILVLYEAMFITLFLALPISKSLEAVPASLYSIYGTGIIIVALLTYNIVLNPSPFSLPKAAERIGKELRLPRRYPNWHKFTDEEKFATLVTYLLRHREDLAPTPEPEYSSGETPPERDVNDVRLLEEQEQSENEEIGRQNGPVRRRRNSEGTQRDGAVPTSATQVITLNTETSV